MSDVVVSIWKGESWDVMKKKLKGRKKFCRLLVSLVLSWDVCFADCEEHLLSITKEEHNGTVYFRACVQGYVRACGGRVKMCGVRMASYSE